MEKEATRSCSVTAIGYVSQFSYSDHLSTESESQGAREMKALDKRVYTQKVQRGPHKIWRRCGKTVFDILKLKVCTDRRSNLKTTDDCTYFPERIAFDFSS